MPANTPLTASPYPLLGDSSNIESAVQPGLRELEKFSIPRFQSLSERNAAFAGDTPAIGQMCYVLSQAHLGFFVWNGSTWEEFGLHTRTRTLVAVKTVNVTRSSSLFGNVPEMSLPVTSGTWRVSVDLHYTTEQSTTDIMVGFTFPGTESRMTLGGIGRGTGATGAVSEASTLSSDTNHVRTSGDFSIRFGGTSSAQAYFATLNGTLIVAPGASGTLQFQYARDAATGVVEIASGSLLTAQRVA